MSSRAPLAWVWTGLVLTASVALVLATPDAVVNIGDALTVTTPTLLTALGVAITTRQPGNRIGWLMFGIGAALLIEPTALLILSGSRPEPVTILDILAVAGENTSFFVGFIIPLALLLHLFPTGGYLNGRWSWAGWLAVATSLGFVVDALFSAELHIADADWAVDNPIGFLSPLVETVFQQVAGVGLLTLVLGGIVAIVVRYRRSDSVVRSQVRLVALSLIFFIATTLYRLLSDDRGNVSSLVFGIVTVLIPISIAVAILRHRLFDIDRLVSRTVGYAVVIGTLALGYLGGALWLPTWIIGEQSPVFVAGSTLAAAALFNPMRRRVIGWVDRRFNRARYDAEQTLAHFAERLKDEIDVSQITSDSVAVISQTLRPESIGVWIRR